MPLPTTLTDTFVRHAKLLRRASGTTLLLLSIAALAHVESTPTLGELARRAPVVQANNPPLIDDVRFIAAHGLLTSKMLIGDDAYLRPGPFVAVRRRTEMFSWAQGRDGDAPTYATGWTETPENSADFDVPQGHENPPKTLTSRSFIASDARVGVFDVDVGSLALPSFQALELASGTVQGNGLTILNDALFVGRGSPDEPQVGDVRIRYEVIPQTVAVTAFGQLNAGRIEPYVAPHGLRLYHLFYGSREAALRKLAPFAGPSPMLFRILATIAVWLSLSLLTRQLRLDTRLEAMALPLRMALLLIAAILLTLSTVHLAIAGGVLWPSVLLSAVIVLVLLLLDVRRHAVAPTPLAQPPAPIKPAVAPTAPPAPIAQPTPAPLNVPAMGKTKAPKAKAPSSRPAAPAPSSKKPASKRPSRSKPSVSPARAKVRKSKR